MKHSWRPVVLAASLLTITSCSGNSERTPANSDKSRTFSGFADEYFHSYFTFHPSEATSAGVHEFDNRLEDWTAPRIAQRIGELKDQQGRLDSLRQSALPADDAIDAQLISARISAELLDWETLRIGHRNPLIYAVIPGQAVDALMKRNFASPDQRLRLVISRVSQVPALMKAMRGNISDVPEEFAELASRTLRGSISFFRDSLTEWTRQASGQNKALLAEFDSANHELLSAMEEAARFIGSDLKPASPGSYAIGAENFAKKLRFEEMVDIPLARLREIGQETLDRDYNTFVETARKISSSSPAGAMNSLANQHPSEAGLLESARATSERIRQFVISRSIIPIPSESRPSIEPTPSFLRAFGFAFMDAPGALETASREAFYYITPTEPNWTPRHKEEHLRLFNKPVMDIITVHEAWPGHYVQFLYAGQFPTKTRKLISCGSNSDGWAHYSEQMMVEQGFGDGDPKMKLAQLSEALVRDVRYLAGIRLHTEGWTVGQAKQLFMEKAFLDEANALAEASRGTYNPTYLYYTLGKLMIYKLRTDVQQKRGTEYSLGEFHRDFVRQGAVPIPVIRRILLGGDGGSTL